PLVRCGRARPTPWSKARPRGTHRQWGVVPMVTGTIAGAGPWPSRVREHGRAPPACRADHRELLGRAQILDLERALKELPSCEREPAADAGEAAIGQRRGAPGAVDPGGEGRDGGLH